MQKRKSFFVAWNIKPKINKKVFQFLRMICTFVLGPNLTMFLFSQIYCKKIRKIFTAKFIAKKIRKIFTAKFIVKKIRKHFEAKKAFLRRLETFRDFSGHPETSRTPKQTSETSQEVLGRPETSRIGVRDVSRRPAMGSRDVPGCLPNIVCT